MGVLIQTASALAFLPYASANPIVQRDSPGFKLPKSYAALGDSFSAGIGSGQVLNNSRDGLDIACIRQDGSYPTLLTQTLGLVDPKNPFNFVSCSGDNLIDIPGQILRLEKKKFDLLTLTIGGNDFEFDDIALNCVYAVLQEGINAQAVCDASFIQAETKVADPAFWVNFTNTLTTLTTDVLEPSGHLFVTGYARFFDEPIVGDACDHISFFPIAQLAALNSTAANRQRGNDLGDLINKGIEDTVIAFAAKHKKRDKHHKKQRVQFIDFDKFFEGKRFCEQENRADPIGANNAQVFFNDLTTVLPTPGVAPKENQTVGLTGVDITNLLQQASVFHPKGQLPYVGLVVEIVFRILLDVIDHKEVVVGPAEWCFGKDAKTHWSREHHDCYNVPKDCAIIKTTTKEMGAPKVYCADGRKCDAYAVEWQTEYDW